MYVFNVILDNSEVIQDVYADSAEAAEKMVELEGYDVLYAECTA